MRVIRPDLELWFTELLRTVAHADGRDVVVSNKEPETLQVPLLRPLILVRDDPGRRLDWTTFDHSVGFSVLTGSQRDDRPANDLARWVASIVQDNALPMLAGSPIARVMWDGCTGPYPVPEQLDVARRYLTGQYIVTGTW